MRSRINFYKILKSNCIFHQSTDWKKYKSMINLKILYLQYSTLDMRQLEEKKVAIFTPNKLYDRRQSFCLVVYLKKKIQIFQQKFFFMETE